jgi:hypothetical protein
MLGIVPEPMIVHRVVPERIIGVQEWATLMGLTLMWFCDSVPT